MGRVGGADANGSTSMGWPSDAAVARTPTGEVHDSALLGGSEAVSGPMVQLGRVPWPGWLSIAKAPPKEVARCSMLAGPLVRAGHSKPQPSSVMSDGVAESFGEYAQQVRCQVIRDGIVEGPDQRDCWSVAEVACPGDAFMGDDVVGVPAQRTAGALPAARRPGPAARQVLCRRSGPVTERVSSPATFQPLQSARRVVGRPRR